jgi:ABC-type multidrug transport system fused ATPase/permease subunit
VQLLNVAILNVLVTALLVSVGISSLATGAAWLLRSGRRRLSFVFLAISAFSILGFVTGEVMGISRESAVGTVVPAVLTLLGGVAVYLVGSKGAEAQANVSAMVLCFAVALLIGSLFGARLRVEYDYEMADPERLRISDLALEQNKMALEVQRLEDYIEILKLKRDFAAEEKLDLSRFDSMFENKPTPSKEANTKESSK